MMKILMAVMKAMIHKNKEIKELINDIIDINIPFRLIYVT